MLPLLRNALLSLLVGFMAWSAPAGPGPQAKEPLVEMLRATCRITHDGHSGTGFFVRRGRELLLVTAAHVFEESSAPECRLIVRERKGDASPVRRELPIRIRHDGKPLWKRHLVEDVAALPVELPEALDVSPLPLAQIIPGGKSGASRVRLGDEVWLPGYPAQLEANAAGWPVLRRGMIASHPLSPVATVPTLLVDIRSFGGDSGAPLFVLVGGVPYLAGVVVGLHRQTDRTVSPIEERTVHTPLGLAIAVQGELVAGVIGQFGH